MTHNQPASPPKTPPRSESPPVMPPTPRKPPRSIKPDNRLLPKNLTKEFLCSLTTPSSSDNEDEDIRVSDTDMGGDTGSDSD